jgi:hypothetical protein
MTTKTCNDRSHDNSRSNDNSNGRSNDNSNGRSNDKSERRSLRDDKQKNRQQLDGGYGSGFAGLQEA